MIYTLKNDRLTLEIADKGAELQSVRAADGCEYLWQGDPAHWASRAPWMFPFCGRQFEGKYTYKGKTYEIVNHGFARAALFEMTAQTDDSITLTLTENAETKAVYPFDFAFSVTYTLKGNTVVTDLTIKNTGKETLPFAVGAHPGFCTPINGKGTFEDCYVEFSEFCCPDKLLFSENLVLSGHRVAFPLEEGRRISLNRPMFYDDATFLAHTSGEVTLRSKVDPHSVTVTYPTLPYVGIWTKPHDHEADYVCIEPWLGQPPVDGAPRRLETAPDTYRLPIGDKKTFTVSFTFT